MMSAEAGVIAGDLVEKAARDQQASRVIRPNDDVAHIRELVRREAKAMHVNIRTGIVEGLLVVVRSDADLWSEPASVMRTKLQNALVERSETEAP